MTMKSNMTTTAKNPLFLKTLKEHVKHFLNQLSGGVLGFFIGLMVGPVSGVGKLHYQAKKDMEDRGHGVISGTLYALPFAIVGGLLYAPFRAFVIGFQCGFTKKKLCSTIISELFNYGEMRDFSSKSRGETAPVLPQTEKSREETAPVLPQTEQTCQLKHAENLTRTNIVAGRKFVSTNEIKYTPTFFRHIDQQNGDSTSLGSVLSQTTLSK